MIRITSKQEGFRRGGIAHSKTPTEYPVDKFSKAELAALEAEPLLTVEIKQVAPQKPEAEVISAIGKAQTLPELNKLIKGDKRQPVLDAFEARKKIIEERPAAKNVIKLIKAAKTVDEVNKIVGKDDRSGVAKEAEKKRQALTGNV